ncbi:MULTISPECIES: BON domain-containing protein [Ramlibacter]|uniref:BON domain-containing protein n=1 Tax=Ramlibacter aquaticus TaxID=2780094 RepID=A0ABR9SJI6_9BURK|nr:MULTISPECIES: BON domain-containing protein [Ramlibacter]MBE7942534.1 BON domain-containing protein [Ramlibacter aquaticus]
MNRLQDRPGLAPLAAVMAFAAGAALTWGLAGLAARWRGHAAHASDEVVARRVRAHAQDMLAQPDAVEVRVEDGIVRVSGRVQASERERFLVGLVDVPGVWRVRNALTVFPAATAG